MAVNKSRGTAQQVMLETKDWNIDSDASQLEAKLLKELGALEAANIHAIISTEDQANEIIAQIDKAKVELNVIDQWLNHYTQVLDSMGADVHQVEVRNKALQMASSNQMALLVEVEKLLAKLKLPGYIVEILKNEPLEFVDGVLQCEDATDRLNEIIETKFDHGLPLSLIYYPGLADMIAVKERIALFQGHANDFATRLSEFLSIFFKIQVDAFLADETRTPKKGNLKLYGHETFEEKLFRFKKLLLWLKGVEARKFHELQLKYTQELGRVYTKETHTLFEQVRQHHIHKVNAGEISYLFVQVSSVSAVATNALSTGAKNVLKSGKALTGLKGPSEKRPPKRDFDSPVRKPTEKRGSVVSLDIANDEKVSTDTIFGDLLAMIIPVIIREQNIIMDMFGFRTTGDVKAGLKDWVEDLDNRMREPIKDVKLQRMIQDLMGGIFGELKEEFASVIENGMKPDQSISLGMASKSEEQLKALEGSANVWLHQLLSSIHKKLLNIFNKFVEDQQKIIEETKVTSRRRTGVLNIFRTFPYFLDKMEGYLVNTDPTSQTRANANRAYEKIVRTLFETLDAVVKDAGNEVKINVDDKEHVNAHIIIVENMHFLYSEMRARRIQALDPFVKQAKSTYDSNLHTYCKSVIRKPLGKLLEFFEGIEVLLKTQRPDEVCFNLLFSKGALKDVVKKYPGKEVAKGLEALYKRVDKHFSGEDGEGSGQLLQVVWRGIQEEVVSSLRSYEELIDRCYRDSGIRLEFSVDEILTSFSDLGVNN